MAEARNFKFGERTLYEDFYLQLHNVNVNQYF